MDLHLRGAEPTATERAAVDALLGPPRTRWEGGRPAQPGSGGEHGGNGASGVAAASGDSPAPGTRDESGEGNGSDPLSRYAAAVHPADLRAAHGGHGARARRHLLLPALHAVNDAVGWVSEGALEYICQRLTVPPAEAYGVATFYAMLSVTPRPPRIAHVCEDIACRAQGADELMQRMEAELGPAGEASGDDGATWERSPCLGLCERAPAVWVQRAGQGDTVCAPAEDADVHVALQGGAGPQPPPAARSAPQVGGALETGEAAGQAPPPAGGVRLLARVGHVDPASLDDYRAAGGYAALRRAVALGPAGVARELEDARLLGRGGAAFPAGVKWRGVATAPEQPHYVVANADESEPGTFKDRVLMEHDPFALVEAMTVAGYATGSTRGYLYLRGEYPLAHERLTTALHLARERGYLGRDVMGLGFDFDIEIRRGAGAYICGEETALLESIEGKRGEPRQKPPFPNQAGLFGKPTLINNVETLVAALDVLATGGRSYAEIGTEQSTGTKLFCVSGSVRRPGVYEVTFGTTVGALLERALGVAPERNLQAVLLGGAAGTFLRPDQLDTPLSFEGTREAGQVLGSGAVIVFDDAVDLPSMLGRVAGFFRDESCGQCVPCRVGTVRQEEALARLARGGDPDEELALLNDLAQVMVDASICGLGQTAPSALQSALSQGLLAGDGQPAGEEGIR